jgi:hypothetical protein
VQDIARGDHDHRADRDHQCDEPEYKCRKRHQKTHTRFVKKRKKQDGKREWKSMLQRRHYNASQKERKQFAKRNRGESGESSGGFNGEFQAHRLCDGDER